MIALVIAARFTLTLLRCAQMCGEREGLASLRVLRAQSFFGNSTLPARRIIDLLWLLAVQREEVTGTPRRLIG